MKKAESVDEVMQSMFQRPLSIDELQEFRVDSTKVRADQSCQKRISLQLESQGNQHILFTGYKGCGKSTELNFLQQKEEEKGTWVINFSVGDKLDIINLHYIEIFILLMDELSATIVEKKITVSNELKKAIKNWGTTKEIEEVKKTHFGLSSEVGAGGNLFGIFAKLTATAKTSSSFKETIKKNIEPQLSELINLCNDLITEVQNKAERKLLFIIEDLDKLTLLKGEEIFLYHSSLLTQINANVIYTFPIALYHHVKFATIKGYYALTQELPMIKVNERDGKQCDEGVKTLQEMVYRRLKDELFENENLLNKCIAKSGGVLRDLFHLVSEAAINAHLNDRTTIQKDDIDWGIQLLRKEYESNIGDYTSKDGGEVTATEIYEALKKLHTSDLKKTDNTHVELLLKQNLSILGYNGEGWNDLHPLIKEILEERDKI